MSVESLLLVTVLGALCGLDRTAFGQTLLAHPVVAASLAGALVGQAGAGVFAGIVMLGLSAAVVPVGERSLRDWTSAAVVLGGLLGVGDDPALRGSFLLFATGWAVVGGSWIRGVRAWTAGRVQRLRARSEADPLRGLERFHLVNGGAHAVRGALTVFVGTAFASTLLPRLVGVLAPPEREALALLWKVAPLVGLPLLLRFHLGWVRPGWVWTGLAVGAVLAWGLRNLSPAVGS